MPSSGLLNSLSHLEQVYIYRKIEKVVQSSHVPLTQSLLIVNILYEHDAFATTNVPVKIT